MHNLRSLNKPLIFLLLFSFTAVYLRAEHNHGPKGEAIAPKSPYSFVENRNQWDNKVLFATDLPEGRLFLEGDRLTYAFSDMEDFHDRFWHGKNPSKTPATSLASHAFQMRFAGSSGAEEVLGHDKRAYYHNYYLGNDPSKWASGVPLFAEAFYKNVYPGIDFRMYGVDDGLKYDFLVAPGTDPDQIGLQYEGLTRIRLIDGELHLVTSVNRIIEQRPIAYQMINGEQVNVPVQFALDSKSKTVSFEFPKGYDSQYELVIDPTLIFSSFTGSTADNFGYTATYDNAGNLYAGGIAFATGYPVTLGAYQTSFAGGGGGGAYTPIDIAITKFASAGSTILYSTYLGGSGNEQPHSLVCNDQDELYIYGKTHSTDYPTSSNAFDRTANGNADMIVSKLNPTGTTLLGSTYIGGSGDDGVNVNSTVFAASSLKQNYGDDSRGDIGTFANGNCVVASCTQSNNFPVVGGVQSSFGGGFQDAVVYQLNSDLSAMVWSTYLGGNGNDAAYTIEIDQNGGVYTAGGTESTNFPTTPGTLNTSPVGGIDGFISHINAAGNTLIKSTYIGTSSYDQVYFLELDANDNVYVLGQTSGSWMVTSGVYSNPNSGQFVTKINPFLSSVVYSTVVGNGSGAPNISPTAFLVDVCEYVYISGWGGTVNAGFIGGTTNGMPTTTGALQTTTDGSDLHIMVLDKNCANLDYATYIGGSSSSEHVDGGTSRFNKRAEIYQAVCAGCWGNSDFPTTNAYSASNNSTGCNLAAFKIEFPLPGILADFTADPDTGGCAPHTVQFINNSIGGTTYYWEFGDGTFTVANSPSHTFNNPGTYTVMLVAIDPASCNKFDTTYHVINVFAPPVAQTINDTTICDNDGGVLLGGSGGTTYQWSPATGLSATNVANPLATPTVTTTYQMIAINPGGCRDTADVTVTVIPSPAGIAGPDTSICPGDNVQLQASGGISYAWTPATGLSNPNIANPVATPSSTTTYTCEITGANGCSDTQPVTITIYNVQANAGANQDLCLGESVQLNASGGGTYSWSPATGLSNPNIANPVATPTTTTTYTLTVANAAGCTDIDDVTVNVFPVPDVQVTPDQTICLLEAATLTATGANTYVWTPTTGLSNPGGATTQASPSTTTTYTVTGTNTFGCDDAASVTVTVLPLPPVATGPDLSMCQDSMVQLSASGAVSYQWSPPAGLSSTTVANPMASPQNTTQYVVTGTGANGCTASDSVTVNVTFTPAVDATDYVQICKGLPIRLRATGGDSIVWSTGESNFSILVDPDSSTFYTVITYVDGCPSLPDTAFVEVYDIFPTAAFTASPDSGFKPLTVSFNNQSVGDSISDWTFGTGGTSTERSPTYIYDEFGEFEALLVVTNQWGCKDTASQNIIVTGDFGIFVPNAFTPNGDGTNDYFNTPHYGIETYEILIFDRWGMMIYESNDPAFQWEGIYKGNNCQEGVYTYLITATGFLGQKFRKAGTVTLLR